MNERVYLHGIGYEPTNFYDPKDQEVILKKILSSGELLSLRLQGKQSKNGFCGMDYIALCDYARRDLVNTGRKRYNSYYKYVINSLSLAFDKDKIKVIIPTLVRICSSNNYGYDYMKILGNDQEYRYTDLPDEVQVKDRVSLENMTAITFPTNTFLDLYHYRTKKRKIELIKEEIECLYEIINNYGYDTKIYDIITLKEMTDENIENLVLKVDKK